MSSAGAIDSQTRDPDGLHNQGDTRPCEKSGLERITKVASVACVLICSFTALVRGSVDVNSLPKPTGYVEDFAHVLNPDDKEALEALCTRIDRELGAQFAIVTIDSPGDQPIQDFALQLGRRWGVGAKETNQGLLILLSMDHQDDIEAGRGIEPYVTDGFAGGVRRAMQPQLRAGEYGAALIQAAQTLANHIAEQKGIQFSDQASARPERVVHREQQGIPAWLIIVGIFFLFWILGRGRRGGGGGGLWTGLLLGNLLSSGRRGGWSDSGWGGGGFGGNSGGGGGFGGFGGGDFGGGGASGNW